ncbi:MAG: 3-hydroxyisobutyryl-CoA hydrolase [Methylocystis sp.]
MSEGDVLVSRVGRLGHIRLNRPKALNSLTLGMVRHFAQALDEFGRNEETIAVLVTGAGDRGLCAGGDIRGLFEHPGGQENPYKQFWREEYRLNAQIASYPKPYVVLMDGIVMGGGVGISAHGNRRLVTERTRLAMPETGIGFIPDVGATWLLTRDGGTGVYIGLSGAIVGAADAISIGMGDLCVDSRDIDQLISALSHCAGPQDVNAALLSAACAPGQSVLGEHRALLNDVMMQERVEDVIASLVFDGSAFARDAARDLERKSPTSLRLTHELLKRAKRSHSLEDCLLQEFRTACALLDTLDLHEGVRAAIIDKDKSPKWSPETLAEVDEARIAALLAGTEDEPPTFEARELSAGASTGSRASHA